MSRHSGIAFASSIERRASADAALEGQRRRPAALHHCLEVGSALLPGQDHGPLEGRLGLGRPAEPQASEADGPAQRLHGHEPVPGLLGPRRHPQPGDQAGVRRVGGPAIEPPELEFAEHHPALVADRLEAGDGLAAGGASFVEVAGAPAEKAGQAELDGGPPGGIGVRSHGRLDGPQRLDGQPA